MRCIAGDEIGDFRVPTFRPADLGTCIAAGKEQHGKREKPDRQLESSHHRSRLDESQGER
jgi:hypothetical protein